MTPRPDLLAMLERSRSLGFLGPGAVDTHVAHAAGFLEMTSESRRVLDLGSGGGVPGLVVAVERPELQMTLLDASERRVAFLRDAVRQLELSGRVDAVLGRAETLARDPDLREQFDTVLSRSFGAPAVTAECAAGFLAVGGRLLVSEPEGSSDRWPAVALSGLGLEPREVHAFEVSTIRELVRVRAGLATVPRSVGLPVRRPLF